jgi:transposase
LKNSPDVIKKSLEGNYTEEHIFILKQNLELYDFYQKQIEACENGVNNLLHSFPTSDSTQSSKDEDTDIPIHFQTKDLLKKITEVDLLAVKGFNTNSLLAIISEVGIDMSKWKTVKHFTSWLGLSPNNKISGGKILHSGTKKTKSYASKILRLCAQSLSQSHSYLGGFYRRLKSRLGAPKANVATARKLATIFYMMLKNRVEYTDLGCDYFDEKHRERSIRNLKKRADALGFSIMECQT